MKNLEISSKYEDRWKRQEKDIYDLWVWNLDKEENNPLSEEFDFSDIHLDKNDLMLLEKNFENFTLKKEDFFLHFENIYKQGESLLLKIAFGAFNKPEHCYLHIGETISFVFKEPFKIQENLKAIKELKKSVKFHFNMKHFLEN